MDLVNLFPMFHNWYFVYEHKTKLKTNRTQNEQIKRQTKQQTKNFSVIIAVLVGEFLSFLFSHFFTSSTNFNLTFVTPLTSFPIKHSLLPGFWLVHFHIYLFSFMEKDDLFLIDTIFFYLAMGSPCYNFEVFFRLLQNQFSLSIFIFRCLFCTKLMLFIIFISQLILNDFYCCWFSSCFLFILLSEFL